ncbi:MAG: hypothetical protein ACTTK0_02305 [Stomatobaculum sp.]
MSREMLKVEITDVNREMLKVMDSIFEVTVKLEGLESILTSIQLGLDPEGEGATMLSAKQAGTALFGAATYARLLIQELETIQHSAGKVVAA